MSAVGLLNAIIDADATRAETTIKAFQGAWGSNTPAGASQLKFVHFRDIEDFLLLARGNNRFVIIAVATSGQVPSSLAVLREFQNDSCIVRLLDSEEHDEAPHYQCKTIRFPLAVSVIHALFFCMRPPPIDTSPICRGTPSSVFTSPPASTARATAPKLTALSPIGKVGLDTLSSDYCIPIGCKDTKKRKHATRFLDSVKRFQAESDVRRSVSLGDTKKKYSAQGPNLWSNISSPSKLILFLDRSSSLLYIRHLDDVAASTFELPFNPDCDISFNDVLGPGSSLCTMQRIIDSIKDGISSQYYLNLYTKRSRVALSAHVSTVVLGCLQPEFSSSAGVVVVMTVRSASVVGNAKLIGYGFNGKNLSESKLLRDNIVRAFGMI